MAEGEPSYIDYEVFLDPAFSPASFANSLVVATNNATDSPLDLSTPLSRVLFDLQEIDTHIHTLTSKSALPLLSHTRDQTAAAGKILQQSEEQIAAVTQVYERLEREVLRKWETADEARLAAEKSLATVRLARAVGRCLNLGRQLESQLAEMNGRGGATATTTSVEAPGREDFRALERAAYTILNLRRMFLATAEGEEGHGLDRVKVVRTLRSDLLNPAESLVKSRAQQAINRFSMSSISAGSQAPSGYKQARDTRARVTSAITTLYILSPMPKTMIPATEYRPELLQSTLHGYMHTAIGTSLTALSRAFTMLPTLERTLSDLSARCQDIVALEYILGNTKLPSHPMLLSGLEGENTEAQAPRKSANLLQLVLTSLDTPSLPSYFWRSLASSLAGRVQEILQRGGVSARALRSNRDRLRGDIKDCVLRGSQLPTASGMVDKGRGEEGLTVGNWEREAAVMVSSVAGAL
ncbi:Golgi transport complex subunit COG5 [Aspergillus chevalieri]|uniref:Conserved oligomeric Golgi complex subunit 5 n=1 Tax=Aspergillus chevalieri TaxID=182096 RepID=A0A7R7VIS4_ASPCH|nr:exosome nuclease subunit [Aspergillus chevalieri]BCR85483.1 exosome nuclease subunit [Aspergillus chevalieri]